MDIPSLLGCFNARRVDYVVVGALAMPPHGYFRASRDIDLFIRPTRDNADRTLAALADAGYDVTDLTPETLQTRKVLFRQYALRTDIHPMVLGAEYEGVAARSVSTSIGGVPTRAAGLDDLIAMKEAAGRPKDLEDLKALRRLRERQG
ncbi:MAG: nucleotidyltransferase [Deltaproteobacteria bacterium]|nr:nucleotidyltransferase [Deltaproteobacteria bacterium]